MIPLQIPLSSSHCSIFSDRPLLSKKPSHPNERITIEHGSVKMFKNSNQQNLSSSWKQTKERLREYAIWLPGMMTVCLSFFCVEGLRCFLDCFWGCLSTTDCCIFDFLLEYKFPNRILAALGLVHYFLLWLLWLRFDCSTQRIGLSSFHE